MIRRKVVTFIKYAFLILCTFVSVFPFYWMIAGATNTSNQIASGKLTFGSHFMENLRNLFTNYPMERILWNSIKVSLVTVVLSLLVTSLAGYGFEKFKTRRSEIVYTIFLIFMMIPFAALIIPLFRMMAGLQLVNTHLAIILPFISNIFLIFLFRQSFKSLPDAIIESAKMEGAGGYTIFFRIVFPMMKSTFAAAAIYSFMNSWNSFILPLVILQTEEQYTLTLLISSLTTASYVPDYGLQMVAIVIGTIPTMLLFLFMQRHFVKGMTGSIKY